MKTGLSRRVGAAAALALMVCLGATAAQAGPNLIQNGNFTNTTATTTYNGVTVGTETTNSNLANWQFTGCTASNCGFSFLANSNLNTSGFYDAADGHESFPGAPVGGNSGGGNAFLSDANYQTQAIYQAVSGLSVGDTYTVAFSQASFEQSGYTGGFTANWAVGLVSSGNAYTLGSTMTNSSGGSTPWTQQALTFVANATNETLFFFATASNGANPPFLLLDNVSLTDSTAQPTSSVPEPASLALVGVGVLGMLMVRRRAVRA